MTPDLDALSTLRRPRLLVRAARFGLADYLRERDLKRAFPGGPVPPECTLVPELMKREADMEARRQSAAAGYSAARHVHVLTVLMAEARRLMRKDSPDPVT
jgi:hypothetical protein